MDMADVLLYLIEKQKEFVQEQVREEEERRMMALASGAGLLVMEMEDVEVPVCAVDSARGRIVSDDRDYYILVSGRFYYHLQKSDIGKPDIIDLLELKGYADSEGRNLESIFKCLAFMHEIRHGSIAIEDSELVLMDGSVISFVAALNSGVLAARQKKDLPVASIVLGNYRRVLDDFIRLLRSGKVLFLPKSSTLNDVADYYGLNVSDRVLLRQILREGQRTGSVPLSIAEDFHLPDEEGVSDLEKLLSETEVLYFKGLDGKLYRVEKPALTDERLISALLPFSLGGKRRQLLPLEFIDEVLKDLVHQFLKFLENAIIYYTEDLP